MFKFKKLLILTIVVTLILLALTSSYALAETLSWQTVNGQNMYGKWIDVGGGNQAFLVYDSNTNEQAKDANGKNIAYLHKSSFTLKDSQIPDGYDLVEDLTRTTHLYAPDNWTGISWRGNTSLGWANGKAFEVYNPYGSTLPDAWRWVIYRYENVNNFAVEATIWANLNGRGTSYNKKVYFAPKEVRYLRLLLNPSSPLDTGSELSATEYITNNYDPEAPVAYQVNPPADDGTGANHTSRFSQGIKITDIPASSYFARGIWGLVPSFKQVPVWNPDDSSNSDWGTITYNAVPAYTWMIVGNYNVVSSREKLTATYPIWSSGTAYTAVIRNVWGALPPIPTGIYDEFGNEYYEPGGLGWIPVYASCLPVRNNVVAYDDGLIMGFHDSYINGTIDGYVPSPAINGRKIERELTMTPTELATFLSQLKDTTITQKVQQIMSTPDHSTSWTLQNTVFTYDGHDYPICRMVP